MVAAAAAAAVAVAVVADYATEDKETGVLRSDLPSHEAWADTILCTVAIQQQEPHKCHLSVETIKPRRNGNVERQERR